MRNFDRSQRLIRYRSSDRTTWPGMAFILESLLLLLFVSASLAVLMALFVQADLMGKENVQRTEAILLATNAAEVFAQDPTSLQPVFEQDGYRVTCEATPEETEAGTLTIAHIAVSRDDTLLFELTTAGYQSQHVAAGHIETAEVSGATAGAAGQGEEILDGPGGARGSEGPTSSAADVAAESSDVGEDGEGADGADGADQAQGAAGAEEADQATDELESPTEVPEEVIE